MEFLSTSDLGLASALVARGSPVVDAVLVEGTTKCKFLFERTRETDRYVDSYWGCVLSCDARTLYLAYKELRNTVWKLTSKEK